MSIDKRRIKRVSDRLAPKRVDPMSLPIPEEELAFLAVFEEYTRLKHAADETIAQREIMRGNLPPVNIARRELGPTYTRKQFLQLAVKRGLRERGYPDDEIAADLDENVEVLRSFLNEGLLDADGVQLIEPSADDDIGAVD